MSSTVRFLKPRSARCLCFVIAALLLTACSASMPPSQAPSRPLLQAVCPPLQPLADDSFGAVVLKLEEVATTYRKCRAAALGDTKD